MTKSEERFYNCMAEALGLPPRASASAWADLGRGIVPSVAPRGVYDGVVIYGIEATFIKPTSRTPTLDRLEAKPTPSLGALLRQALERNKQAPADPNAAMIARDGNAKPAPAVVAAQPASTAKPPIAGLTLSPDLRDSSHQVSPGFGSALLGS